MLGGGVNRFSRKRNWGRVVSSRGPRPWHVSRGRHSLFASQPTGGVSQSEWEAYTPALWFLWKRTTSSAAEKTAPSTDRRHRMVLSMILSTPEKSRRICQVFQSEVSSAWHGTSYRCRVVGTPASHSRDRTSSLRLPSNGWTIPLKSTPASFNSLYHSQRSYHSTHLPGGTKENHDKSVRMVGYRVQDGTRDISSTKPCRSVLRKGEQQFESRLGYWSPDWKLSWASDSQRESRDPNRLRPPLSKSFRRLIAILYHLPILFDASLCSWNRIAKQPQIQSRFRASEVFPLKSVPTLSCKY
jgi:hypothetical protein